MFAHVRNTDAQIAAPLVNIQLAQLEHCPDAWSTGIEIREQDKILQKPVEIPVIVHQFLDVVDGTGLSSEGLVPLN